MKSIKALVIASLGIAAAILIAGCATGSGLAIGSVHYEATEPESVQVLTKFPETFETVGFVEASAPKGYLTKPELAAQSALEELKRQAAKLGATAVVIKEYSSQQVPDFSLDDDDALGLVFTTEHKTITAEAIRI